MQFISLFAGIGGFDLGLERAGMECVAQVEIDGFCQKVLTKHWPDVPKFGDIRDVGKHNLPAADLICGGFPCQPFSVAGKQGGTADDRHLWPEMLRVITELKPAWIVGENVPGIINIFLDQAISDLEDQGYTCEPVVLPACAFDAPHRRDRIFIVAYSISPTGRGGELVREGNRQGWEPTKTERESIQPGHRQPHTGEPKQSRETMADTRSNRLALIGKPGNDTPERGNRRGIPQNDSGQLWEAEPSVGRVANGVPNRVDRLKSLGNAVVPQVAEFIGRAIMEAKCKTRS